MKKLMTLCLTLSILVLTNPIKKAQAANPLIISAAVSAGIMTGIGISYTLAGSLTDATAASMTELKMEYLENVQNDALEYIATEGEVVSTILSNVIEASYKNIELEGLSLADVDELELVYAIVKATKSNRCADTIINCY